jgi:hypothetical protein
MSYPLVASKELLVRQYYLFLRKRIFYVQFTDQKTKKRLSAISTGKTTRDEALFVVAGWFKDGIPRRQPKKENIPARTVDTLVSSNQLFTGLKQNDLNTQDVLKIEKILKDKGLIEAIVKKHSKESEDMSDYLRRFWDYGCSPYIAEKLSHGGRMGKTHAKCCLERANLYWVPYFSGKRIGEITKQDLKDFSVHIAQEHPNLSTMTLRQIRLVGVTALKWAFANELISADPTIGLPG